jgi:hypothetical protein
MTISPWLKIGVSLFAIVSIFLGVVAWLQEHDARLKADSIASAQQTVIDQAKKDSAAKDADKAQVIADLKQRLNSLEAQKSQPITAPQFVVDLNKLLPNLPQPATVIAAQPETKLPNGETKPAVPETVQIPTSDLVALRNYKLSCDQTGAKLDACEKQSALLDAQLKDSATENGALTKQRDAYKTAAKGGSFLHRLAKGAKCLAFSGGAAAAGAWVDRNQPARGAAIGVVAGSIGCQVF